MKTGIALSIAAATTLLATPLLAATTEGVPQFDHQFVIMMENRHYSQIIGSPNTPYINSLANTYNLETNYFGTTHPSLPNYLDVIAGSNFGIGKPFNNGNPSNQEPLNDNPPYWSAGTPGAPTTCDPTTCNQTINSPSIVDQLTVKGLTWKTYQENLPSTGSNWANSTVDGTKAGTNDKLYAVKHNPFAYFATGQSQGENMVDTNQLTADLASGKNVPNFSFIAPNQCNDMHGDPAGGCPYGNPATVDANEQALLQTGDNYLKTLVPEIMNSPAWSKGNNVIYVLWDENDYSNLNNQVPLIAITNNGPTGIKDNNLANHYSLLRTIEDGFGITDYLNNAQTAQPLTNLLVPEPVNMLGVGLAGIMGMFLKRSLTKKR